MKQTYNASSSSCENDRNCCQQGVLAFSDSNEISSQQKSPESVIAQQQGANNQERVLNIARASISQFAMVSWLNSWCNVRVCKLKPGVFQLPMDTRGN